MIETGVLVAHTLLGSGQVQEIQSSADLPTEIQQIAQQFAAVATRVLGTLNTTLIEISRAAYISAVLIGLLLYSTHLERRLGRDLIRGGLVLAILSEIVFPLITKV